MESLSVTRMTTLLACPRKHYWRYECRLRRIESTDALRFGSAWHAAIAALSTGAPLADAYAAGLATCTGTVLDELQAATLFAMLAGYNCRYGNDRIVNVQGVEVPFETPIDGSRTFRAAGVIDALGVTCDGRQALVEYKTTSSSIEPESEYWLRLRADPQLLQYVIAARGFGWEPSVVIYDVARKPAIAPKSVPVTDSQGRKVVLDAAGQRVFKANGEPRETGDSAKGYVAMVRTETVDEFRERLSGDINARPDFYLARREVPVLRDDLEEFLDERLQVAKMILDRRAQQRTRYTGCPHRAWPRHRSGFQCPHCEYSGFCLQGTIPDLQHPPAGFVVEAGSDDTQAVAAG